MIFPMIFPFCFSVTPLIKLTLCNGRGPLLNRYDLKRCNGRGPLKKINHDTVKHL